MRALFDTVLSMSLAGSWAIAFVLAARLLLCRAPARFRYLLWGLALLRLLCPVTLESPASLLPQREPVSVNAPAAVQPAAPAVTVDAQGGVPVDAGASGAADGSDAGDNPGVPPAPTASPALQLSLRQLLLRTLRALWLPGAALLLAGALHSFWKLRKRLIGAVPLRDNIWLADHIDTAFVLGVFRPRIYLPSSLPPEEQPYILLHEQTHLRRRDPLWKLLGFAALCIHWFNPLVWLALRCAERDMELSCDEAVLARLGPDIRQAYAASLLRLSAGRQAGIAFGESGAKARIRNVLRYRNPKLLVSLAGAAAVILLACGLLTDPVKPAALSDLAGSYWTGSAFSGLDEPDCWIIAEGSLYVSAGGRTDWQGALTETALDGYDALLADPALTGAEWQHLKRENRCAWRAEEGNALLLLQRDGSLYLLRGQTPSGGDAPQAWEAFPLEPAAGAAALLPGDYAAVQILYDAPEYSFTYTPGAMPVYTIPSAGNVTVSGGIGGADLGELEEIALTRENFDALFHIVPAEQVDQIREAREQAERAWILRGHGGPEFQYLILQKGRGSERTLLLASGYQEDGVPASIRWLFLLARDPDAAQAQAAAFPAGEYSAAALIYDASDEPEELPVYSISQTGQGVHLLQELYEQFPYQAYAAQRGGLYPIALRTENFDALFRADGNFRAERFRQSNVWAWQLIREQEFYQVLLQSDGQVYLVKGVSESGVPLLALRVYRLAPQADGMQKLPYRQAYDALLAFRTEGYAALTAAEFNRTLAPDAAGREELFERYSLVSENLPADDPNADFFQITLNASCGEIYAETSHETSFFAIPILDQRRPVTPSAAEELELLSVEIPQYHFLFLSTACLFYELDGAVTVETRDGLLRALRDGLRDYVAAQSEDFLLQNDMGSLLAEQAQAILNATPHEGIELSIEFENTEAYVDG